MVRSSPLKVAEIARRVGISRTSLYDLLNGKSLPKKSTFNRLIEVLQPIYKESESLRTDYEIELLRGNRNHRMLNWRKKQQFVGELADQLLAKGHEIARSPKTVEVDLVLRLEGNRRIPILAQSYLLDPSQVLGTILFAMHSISSDKGFVCIASLKGLNRSIVSLFNAYGVRIFTPKSLLKELK